MLDFLEKNDFYLFILGALLISAVYYVGVKTDAQVLGNVFVQGWNVITGRKTSGEPSGYPLSN